MKQGMSDDMFYGASKLVFQKAEELRNFISTTEKTLWAHLEEGKLGAEFKRRHPVSSYVLDFYCHEFKIAVEIAGTSHILEDRKPDPQRDKLLIDKGIAIVRFTEKEVISGMQQVLDQIKRLMIIRKATNNAGEKPAVFEIIPAIDIIDGKCVRLTQGDYEQKKIYNEHPLEVARQFEDTGLNRLHLVDLDGAKSGRVMNWKVLEAVTGKTNLVIDFGGGIKSDKDLEIVFGSGAAMATIGSMAVKDEDGFSHWLKQYGTKKFFLGADVKEEKIAVSGWQETTAIWVYDFLQKYIEKGISNIFCTDVSRDGLLEGPAIELYKSIVGKFPGIHFVASGGVSSINDLDHLRNAGCKGAIVGKAIYEGRISLDELRRFG
ncbi:MAG: 1-(5-phosphoribosyl)-5-[(5-phosphoribosylamino)methylideneamino]imidazole-4-carboxamide isomerase [Chitinophagaceae bacterium]